MSSRDSLRITIITSNYWPERTGIGQVVTEFAEFLAARGLIVKVATAMPYYPEWSIYQQYKGHLWKTERRNEVTIHRAAHHVSPNPSIAGRILHEASLCALSLPNIIRALNRADVAVSVSPDLSHAFVGCIAARVMRKPVILYVQDIMPDAAIEMGMLTNKVAIRVSRFLARANYRLADSIYTLSDGMRTRIAAVAGSPRKIDVVPNTIDAGELSPRGEQGRPFRDKFVPPGTFAVVHTGNMGEKQNLFLLLGAARHLRNERNIHFYVFGDGAVKGEFLRRRDELRLDNVSHYPLQDRWLLPHILHGADVCLITQLPTVTDVVVPSKLITAMGAGALIVAACSPTSETAAVLNESGGAIVVSPSDDVGLAQTIKGLSASKEDIASKRIIVRDYANRHFGRETVYGGVVESLTESLTQSRQSNTAFN
jgi:colanic acid biosynthesis glycosyl transferase WcaI